MVFGHMIRQYELVERVKAYDPLADEALLNRAYVFGTKAHGAQIRANGDPYFSHPVEVAGILTELHLDTACIIAGLLHDTIEDTHATLADIERLFGGEVAQIVDGVTKLSSYELKSEENKQAENFQKLLLAVTKDIRVLLVKLADRLHNMRTLHYIQKPEKRERIARETLEIYAPLADRIGLTRLREELQDLAFETLMPEMRGSIIKRLEQLRLESSDTVAKVIFQLRRTLAEGGVEAAVTGREKKPYSIWEKMQRKSISFEQLADIMAFRAVVGSVADCYQALGLLHAKYPAIEGRFKDYMSAPKRNGYRSLHTAITGPEHQRIEVQIRTQDMHDFAEHGLAAHWAYKQGVQPGSDDYQWIKAIKEVLEHSDNPREVLEHAKMELYADHVFCYTPKGLLIELPRGATPIDFAYAVHSKVGDSCVGAKVNGRMVPLRSKLENGDTVEIKTSKTQSPSPEWEQIAVTGRAKARIRRFIKQAQRDQHIALGRSMIEQIFKRESYEYSEKALEGVLRHFQAAENADLLAKIGAGDVGAMTVFNAIFPAHRHEESKASLSAQKLLAAAQTGEGKIIKLPSANTGKGAALPIRGLIRGMAVHYARCCHPLPGDRIVGIVTTGKGVTIHTIDCEALQSFHDTPERWLDVSWDAEGVGAEQFVGRLFLVLAHSPGTLGAVTTVIAKSGGNISNLKIVSRSSDFFELLMDIEVSDNRHLNNIIAALRATPVVHSVERERAR
jgi:GTP diphosphokinase / guanosine-3',5'-bis(diphosphate) 3'-diphosphatase